MEVRYAIKHKAPLVPILHSVDCMPSFFIVGGLVFMQLSMPLLESACGVRKWRNIVPLSVIACMNKYRVHPRQQIIVLVQVLSDEVNHGYKFTIVPVKTFNGQPVKNLESLAYAVDSCRHEYLKFGLERGRLVTLDRQEAVQRTPQILSANGIPKDRSQDLLDTIYDPALDDWEQGPDACDIESSITDSMSE